MIKLHKSKLKLTIGASMIWIIAMLLFVGRWSSVEADSSDAQAACDPFNFQDATNGRDPTYNGATFHLSQNYPTSLPTNQAKPWQQFNFRTQPEEYLQSVLDYVLDGNKDTSVDFQGDINPIRTWYHAPELLESDYSSREYIHGLTRERGAPAHSLHPMQADGVTNYAVSMYNPLGGYIFGRVWCDPTHPSAAEARFPSGTVAMKLLFTTATVDQVPYLVDAKVWQAYVVTRTHTTANPPAALGEVRLLQLDVAVRDTRANSTTGWVFGTFVYDGTQPGATVWDKLVPIGLMWGNDPLLTQARYDSGRRPTQSIILNRTIGGVPLKLGANGRLNGPVDNPVSSCLSCHSTAQDQYVHNIVPNANMTEAERMNFFRNIRSGSPFETGQTSLDYSLQLAIGIRNVR